MRELDHLIGVKRAIPDAFGNWTPVSAYEGWRPEEPAKPTFTGLVFTLISVALAAWIAVHLGVAK